MTDRQPEYAGPQPLILHRNTLPHEGSDTAHLTKNAAFRLVYVVILPPGFVNVNNKNCPDVDFCAKSTSGQFKSLKQKYGLSNTSFSRLRQADFHFHTGILQPFSHTLHISSGQIGRGASFSRRFCPDLQECGTGSPFLCTAHRMIFASNSKQYNFALFLEQTNIFNKGLNF